MIAGENRNRIGVEDGFTDVSELRVNCMADRVNDRRLVIARNNDAGASTSLEIQHSHLDESLLRIECTAFRSARK